MVIMVKIMLIIITIRLVDSQGIEKKKTLK